MGCVLCLWLPNWERVVEICQVPLTIQASIFRLRFLKSDSTLAIPSICGFIDYQSMHSFASLQNRPGPLTLLRILTLL